MKTTFKNGDRIVSQENDWTHGLIGTINDDGANTRDWVRVDFDPKEANREGWGKNNASWYVKYDWMKRADELTLGTEEFTTSHFRAGSQSSRILAHLLKGKSITQGECNLVYGGTWRLSDIILKIRRAGFEVVTDMKEDEAGHEYASYSLAAKAA